MFIGIGGGISRLGGARALLASTLNPLDADPAVVLSNGNLTATKTAAGSSSVRSTQARATGKLRFEVTSSTATAGGFPIVGVANAAQALNNFIGSTANSAGLFSQAFGLYQNGVMISAAAESIGSGATVAYEIDLDARQFSWKLGGSSFREGPYNISATGPLFVGISVAEGGAATINFGATPFIVPAAPGFTAWG